MRYAQAIKGNFQVALDYANALVADEASPHHLLHRQERGVVLRLLGKHAEALQEFDELLAPGFDYECHIERSCVKYLMGDKDGARKEARHAHRNCPARDGQQLMSLLLSSRAIPPEFCAWISNVCNTSNLCCNLMVPPGESSSAHQVAASASGLSEITDPLNFVSDVVIACSGHDVGKILETGNVLQNCWASVSPLSLPPRVDPTSVPNHLTHLSSCMALRAQ